MTVGAASSVAILYPGDRSTRDRADPAASRFAPLFAALGAAGVRAEPAVYQDDVVSEVEAQLQSHRWRNCRRSCRARLALGARVLKQQRGHSGIGVWRIERLGPDRFCLRHAQRGSQPEEGPFARVLERLTFCSVALRARMSPITCFVRST